MVGQKIRIYPTEKQKQILNNYFGYARWSYNEALTEWKEQYKNNLKPTERKVRDALKTKLPEWTKGYPKSILDMSCENLGNAFSNFFNKKARYPKYKSKRNCKESFSLYRKNNSSIRISGKIWKLQKEKIKMSEELRFTSEMKRLTCSCKAGKYYISIVFDENLKKPDDNFKYVGLDWGLDSYFITSDNNKIKLPDLTIFEKEIKFRQRCLSNKKTGSNRYMKARTKLQRVYEKLENIKKDSQNKMISKLINEYSHIATEDLSFKGLVKINKNRKNRLKKILQYSNYEIMTKLSQKSFEYVKINRFFPSSQTCSNCGQIHTEMKNDRIRTLECDCGLKIDRDYNAAINIKTVAFNI